MRLLVVDDDIGIQRGLVEGLHTLYAVDASSTGSEALYLSEVNSYDAILLDVNLPDFSGIELCQRMRSEGVTSPILMLTGVDDLESKVAALDSGADDYVTKPFRMREVEARLRALLRRPSDLTAPILEVGGLRLDPVNRLAFREGIEILLRRKEFDILEYLMRNANRVVTRTMILEHVWDDATEHFSNTVDVHLKHLRDKVDKPYPEHIIRTITGVGYMLTSSRSADKE